LLTRVYDGTYNVCPEVASKLSLEPMLAAAMICVAQPQSMDATEAIDPIVFASAQRIIRVEQSVGSKSLTAYEPTKKIAPSRGGKRVCPKIKLLEEF
jgi:hypothetical protein